MTRHKRKSLEAATADNHVVTSSRDNVIALQPDAPTSETTAPLPEPTQPPRKSGIRHSYHASLYLPEEAQFALREIALAHRKPKPHDVLLEAVADLFERNGKLALAKACRDRITPSRDGVIKGLNRLEGQPPGTPSRQPLRGACSDLDPDPADWRMAAISNQGFDRP